MGGQTHGGSRVRSYIPAPCGEAEVLRGISWLANWCGTTGVRGGILLPSLRQLDFSILTKILGPAGTKYAKKHSSIGIPSSKGPLEVGVFTEKQLKTRAPPIEAALLLWPSASMFEEIDRFGRTLDFVAVAWTEEEGEAWERQLGLVALGKEGISSAGPIVLNAALESLSSIVNKSTGIAHASDRASLVEMLYLLEQGGEQLDADFCSRRLIELGWRTEYAKEVADIMRRFVAGSKPRRTANAPWRPDILEQWRLKARGESP